MDVALGMSVAPEAIRTVLVEGAGAGGVTVDQDDLRVAGTPSAAAAADLAIATVLRTRKSAAAGGYRLRSTGITCTDDADAAALRDALARRRIDNVTLVSAFTAAAALAQALGSASGRARTALLFVEPATATLAVVDTADGVAAGVRRQPLARGDAAIAQLAAMVSGTAATPARPGEVFLVGSGVDIPSLKAALEAATPLPVIVPEEPERALARGAALAAATVQLGAPPTLAIPSQDLTAATQQPADAAEAAAETGRGRRSRTSVLVAGAVLAMFVAGVVALVLGLTIRPHSPTTPVPPAKTAAPAPPPSATPAPPPPPEYAAPRQAPAPAAPAPGPTANPPQQGPPLSPGGDDHGGGAWVRRHLDRYGIPLPWP